MKIYQKADLKMKDGLIINDAGEIVAIDPEIVDLANNLETELQQARFLADQPEASPMPTLVGFKRKSMNEIELFECETPIQDKRAEDAMKLMEEIDQASLTTQMNLMLTNIKPLVLFAKDSDVIAMEATTLHRFDTPFMGNPLEWTEESISQVVAEINGCTIENDVESE